jgi:sterol 3beta-glucosyltransferase
VQVAIVTIGSHGDVQPYVALGVGLQSAGHKVRLITHGIYEAFARGRGLDFFALEGDPRGILTGEAGRDMLEAGSNPVAFMLRFARAGGRMVEDLFTGCRKGCEGAEAIIFSVTGLLAAGYHVAEAMGVPFYGAFLQPVHPTRAYPDSIFPEWPCRFGRGTYNIMAHRFAVQLAWQLFRGSINRNRADVLHLRPLPFRGPFKQLYREQHLELFGFSPSVLPKPADWGQTLHVTGYWYLDTEPEWQPPAALVDFLQSGPPPLYIGFGSMPNRDPERTTRLLVQALARTGQRAVLHTGWGGLSSGDLPDYVFPVEAIPHDWLFPRMSAVVHHGGLGTTAEGLRAGVPSVIIPFFADQPFWAQRVFQLGVSPRYIPRKHLSVQNLADAICTATSDPAMRRRAGALGERIRAENGVGHAVDLFNQYSAAH